PRVHHLSTTTRIGQSGARNLGIDAASGRFLAFQDSDDVWEDNKLEVQLRVMTEAPGADVAAVGCGWVSSNGSRRVPPNPARSYVAGDVLRGCVTGTGTPMLLLDRQVADGGVRFDTSFPAFEERDYLLRSLRGARLLVAPQLLVRVGRGRADHVASAVRAMAGYERFLTKYSSELAQMVRVRDWYRYMSMREALRAGRTDIAREHYRAISSGRGVRLRIEYLLGRAAGRRGLAVASRLHVRPDWSDRCADRRLGVVHGLTSGR
ncbi:MAG: glycosyltransferase family 2 protein, partial [Actinomycetota bacterium]